MTPAQPITIAVLALGGQGGGVLADWIVSVAEHEGYAAQSTSVPGVAQRTGATVYYVELLDGALAKAAGKMPVLALQPVPGQIDIAIGAELLEAGRAVLRGFVTSDRTTLIASSHRDFAFSEKSPMSDGRANRDKIIEAARKAAKQLICVDMAAAATESGSIISAVLLGALAGSGTLPFARSSYEAAIREAGVAVESNLRGFARGLELAISALAGTLPTAAARPRRTLAQAAAAATHPAVKALFERALALPPAAHPLLVEGIVKLVDYQDPAYAALYLERLERFATRDGDGLLTAALARYLALWMAYEDTIRVADLKTRSKRFARFRDDVKAAPGQIVDVVEFMHPRWQEVCETMPAAIGQALQRSRAATRLFAPLFKGGRHVRTTSLTGFLMLWVLGRWKGMRQTTLRHRQETARIEAWLAHVSGALEAGDTPLAVEIARLQRLIKGYSDTFERGVHRFGQILAALALVPDPRERTEVLRLLSNAALADEEGKTLANALNRLSQSAQIS